jgi:hypothetical protein
MDLADEFSAWRENRNSVDAKTAEAQEYQAVSEGRTPAAGTDVYSTVDQALGIERPDTNFIQRFTADAIGAVKDYGTGAAQGYQEWQRSAEYANQVLLDPNATDDEKLQAVQYNKKAAATFGEETALPAAMIVGSAIAPITTLAAGTAYMAKQGYDQTGTIGGAIEAATYGPAKEMYNDPELAQKFEETPARTTVNAILGVGQAVLPLAGLYKGAKVAKGKVNEKVAVKLEEIIPTENATPARPQINIEEFGKWKEQKLAAGEEIKGSREEFVKAVEEVEKPKEAWQMTREEHRNTLGARQFDTSIPQDWDLPQGTRFETTAPEIVTAREIKELDLVKSSNKPAAIPDYSGDDLALNNWISEAENRGLQVTRYVDANGNDSAIASITKEAAQRVINAPLGSEEKGLALGFKTHKQYVEQALQEGKKVPAEVLKDYPDLAINRAITEELGAIGKVEQALADEINLAIEPVTPAIGMSVKETTKLPAERIEAPKIKFENADTESRWQEASKGIQKQSIADSLREATNSLWNKATRVYEDLPNVPEFAQLKFDLLKLEKQKSVAADRTNRLLQGITLEIKDKPALDLFTRKVVLDDLAQTNGDLPFGLNAEQLAKDLASVDQAITQSPAIAKAIETRRGVWDALKKDYTTAMKSIGFNVEDRIGRQDYFRHQVLEYANLRAVAGSGERLKSPTGRAFLKGREGSVKDINANYLQAEFEVMAQMLHDVELAKTIAGVEKNYSLRAKLFEQFGEQWRENIPEGYTTWQPREGTSFYLANAIPEKLATQVLSGALEEVGVGAEQIKQVLAKGAPFKELVVKQEVADTLNRISTPPNPNAIIEGAKTITGAWKQWVLMGPTRAIKYNLRNITGDADALFAMNRSAFKEVPNAVKELYQTVYGDKAMTSEMGEWFRRGGMETTLQVQELPDINGLRMFEKFADKDSNYIKRAWISYWDKARTATQFRESIFRYATYRDYLKQMQENGGKPRNFGASVPDDVMSLPDIRDRAFKLSNEVLGAYDNVSALGKDIRTSVIPFWSWYETNFTRYSQFLRNQANDGSIGEALSRKLVGNVLIRSPYYAYSLGSFTVKAGALWAALQAYNNLVYPNEEKELPVEEQARPHLVLGRDENGKVKYFSRLGSFPDFLEWFGLDTPVRDVKDFLDGTRTMKEIAQDMGKSPVNKLAQGVSPLIKTPAEIATGKRLFPDVFNARSIKDNPQYIAESLGLGNEFKAISKTETAREIGIAPRPAKPYSPEIAGNLLYYKAEPNQSAYYSIQDKKREFLKSIGKGGDGEFSSPKSDALRNYKIALRLKDTESAGYYLTEYKKLGGTKKGLQKSLESLDPLAGIKSDEVKKFKQGLTVEQQKELEKATTYYKTVLLGK